jgi:hypothetical protein
MNPRIQRFVVGSGDADKFDVLEGRRLNREPLSRAEALTERDDEGFEAWPGEVDRINISLCPLIVAVFDLTAPGSLERKVALSEVLAAVERVKRALVPLPKLH